MGSSVLSPLPICSQMFAAEENVDFRIHVENQTRARDDVSRKQLRLYQLYSRTSGKHIQVLGRRISAKGEDGDKYGKDIYWDPPDSKSKAVILCGGLRTSWEKNKKSNKKQDKRKKKPFQVKNMGFVVLEQAVSLTPSCKQFLQEHHVPIY